jgi:putative ABC transport system ATP-binding protein
MGRGADVAVAAVDLRFRWRPGDPDCLDLPAFTVAAGEAVFLHGRSGGGKSTLLNLLAGVAAPRAGALAVLGHDFARLPGAARDRVRADRIGFVFQQFNLLPYLSALDNVLLATRFSARRHAAALRAHGAEQVAARALLGGLGIDGALAARRADALSVGQQQRVAAARALIGEPALIIADEPTSALDDALRDVFLAQLLALCRAGGAALVFVSHDRRLGAAFDRVVAFDAINRARAAPAGEPA